MTKSYSKNCDYCQHEITMSDNSGKWLPYNKDGSAHDCRADKQESATTTTTTQTQTKATYYSLQDVLKKLESFGIILNVERLMSQK